MVWLGLAAQPPGATIRFYRPLPKLSLSQLPVPVLLPITPDSSDPTVTPMKSEEDLNFKSEMKKPQHKRNERKDGQEDGLVTEEGQRHEIPAPNGKTFDEHEGKRWCCYTWT